ncbi:MAG: ABC transporter permease [Aureispira sp.]|nr:ABC transporter permease [Aureispira sp.]
MNLPFKFAQRYIFSKKSTNAINIISLISVAGIALGSMALIVILSVFNGFEDLLNDLISSFKPDIHVSVKEGKVFSIDSATVAKLEDLEGVEVVSQTLEEVALFEYQDRHNLGILKGVDANYKAVTAIDTNVRTGEYNLRDVDRELDFGVIGATIEYTLGVSVGYNFNEPMTIYMPKRKEKKTMMGIAKPFKKRKLYPVGIYSVRQADYDNCILTNLKFTQSLLSYKKKEISALEIKLSKDGREATQAAIQEIMGDKFSVKNRYQQDEAFFKITNLEKWVGYIIFTFTLMLVAFNMVGALWMLVLEKKKDIATLKAMGATNGLVRNIFLMEGLLLSFIGVVIGCTVAAILCVLQQQYGLVTLDGSGEFIVDAYPVSMRISDFVIVFITVLVIGTLAALLPAIRASKISGLIRNN